MVRWWGTESRNPAALPETIAGCSAGFAPQFHRRLATLGFRLRSGRYTPSTPLRMTTRRAVYFTGSKPRVAPRTSGRNRSRPWSTPPVSPFWWTEPGRRSWKTVRATLIWSRARATPAGWPPKALLWREPPAASRCSLGLAALICWDRPQSWNLWESAGSPDSAPSSELHSPP
ncbi:hypothetical protein CfE428DRAFT_3374 [Chthoniobacter flavus Ellin428]|uniref:Uncharacterized protein n=1 Tax=Chthoniobacter flavus Ellin428 TaxID=497964 RepID=B4D386_9BACT|nr:hypothetical protein CfE428DRAFT_3374 [Chthoniobacter flavus Ellin428]